ncbi:phosphate/phosphite/phosphonate ABC transporter substrate-binding protein [Thiosocius teredinicola]|uniref:phosphate/phosphite/phosphonate ABC transporter substrate-binding protein n=1 Tax=Thiosocius teredinicola TaxID=1973002 RepID=UPI0009912A5D
MSNQCCSFWPAWRVAVALLLFAVLASPLGPASAASPSKKSLIIGVHPFLPYADLQGRFQPLAHYLAEELDRPVHVRIGRDYEEHLVEIGKDAIDIAFLGPVSYIEMVKRFGRKPLLAQMSHQGIPSMKGHIIVPTSSHLGGIRDLKGKSFAFSDPYSTMGTVIPSAALADQGVRLKDLSGYTHYRGYTNVALAVLSGHNDAGAVNDTTYHEFAPLGIRSLATLPDAPEHLFVARSDMPPALVEKLRELLLGLQYSYRGRMALRAINSHATGLVAASDERFDKLRQLLSTVEQPAEQERAAK